MQVLENMKLSSDYTSTKKFYHNNAGIIFVWTLGPTYKSTRCTDTENHNMNHILPSWRKKGKSTCICLSGNFPLFSFILTCIRNSTQSCQVDSKMCKPSHYSHPHLPPSAFRERDSEKLCKGTSVSGAHLFVEWHWQLYYR